MSTPYGHSMLPNESHPGPGCSCRDCLSAYPDDTPAECAITDDDYDGAPYCSDCGALKRQYCECPPHPRND